MPYLFVLLFSLFQPSAPAPADALRPGNAVLDSARLTTGADSLALVVVHNGEAGIAGLMTLQTVHRADEMIRTETLFDSNGTVLHQDSFAVAAATLAPRYRVAAEGLRTFEKGAFYANSLDLVLGALPLGDGYTADLALTSDEAPEAVASLRVMAQEAVQTADGGACQAWRIQVLQEAAPSFYWIGADTGRLVQFVSPADGLAFVRLRGCPPPS